MRARCSCCKARQCEHEAIRALCLLQDLPLNGFDIEARKFVLEQYKLRGIKYHGLSSPSKITKEPNGRLTVTVDPYKREGESFTIDNVDQVGLRAALPTCSMISGITGLGLLHPTEKEVPGCQTSLSKEPACAGPFCNWEKPKDKGHRPRGHWSEAE